MIEAEDEKPIVSLLADDPIERPRIEAFVLALSDRVDALQDLEQEADFSRIAAHARALGDEAERHGFPLLARASARSVDAASARDAQDTRKALVALTEVARRVRLGHRGAPPPGF
ncbi:hypothetical protein MYXO_03001 [Myxococcaceae bacterium]|jgi:hypothetical protein|nr:hypothetical protein MYXO_03001 [Myxococcaceae bacterium]